MCAIAVGRGRGPHRGVRARVLAQSISQPVANVARFLEFLAARPRSSYPSFESRFARSVLRGESVYDVYAFAFEPVRRK